MPKSKQITMTPRDYFSEHTHLVKMLQNQATALNREANRQHKEQLGWAKKLHHKV
jgi:hypothetical protein